MLGGWAPRTTSKWLGSPPFISHEVRPFGRGPTTRSLGDLLTMVINHLLSWMILQVREWGVFVSHFEAYRCVKLHHFSVFETTTAKNTHVRMHPPKKQNELLQ